MDKLHSSSPSDNLVDLPLFVEAERQCVRAPLPWAARRLVRRHGVPPSIARIVAELAGFKLEEHGQ